MTAEEAIERAVALLRKLNASPSLPMKAYFEQDAYRADRPSEPAWIVVRDYSDVSPHRDPNQAVVRVYVSDGHAASELSP